jgi:hypothetical protein
MCVDDRLRDAFESRRRYHQLVRRTEALRAHPRADVRLLASRRLEVIERAGAALELLRRR